MKNPSFSLYDASAGSGKTHTLVKEYLKIVLRAERPDAYRSILAITFTNKAVHEMKSRIVETLHDFTREKPSGKSEAMLRQISVETEIPQATLIANAKRVIKHLIHNYAAFDISTIDKFTHRVIRSFMHDLELPAGFEIALDTDNLLGEAVDALVARAGDDELLTKVLIDFALEKTDGDKSWDVTRDIFDTGKLVFNENHRRELEHYKDRPLEEFHAIRGKLIDRVKELEEEGVGITNEILSVIASLGIEDKSFNGGYLPKYLKKLSLGDIHKSDTHFKYFNGEKNPYAGTVAASQKQAIDSIAPKILDTLHQIQEVATKLLVCRALLKELTPLSMLNSLTGELDRIRSEQKILPISEFNTIVHQQIQGQPAPFIYEKLGERYRHYFIDEFQDTSELQWQNLVPLINNSISGQDDFGEKGTLLIVGDPKQSIYRWRGGKAEQFIELGKGNHPFNLAQENFRTVSLGTNWRSYSEVVSFNNDFFKFLSGRFEHPDYKNLYEHKSAQEHAGKLGGHVRLTFLDTKNIPEEDLELDGDIFSRAVVDRVRELQQQGFRLGEIAVLFRKKENGAEIARELTAAGIAMISSESLRLDSSADVQALLDVLRYLDNPENKEARAGWLYYLGNRRNPLTVADFIGDGMTFLSDVLLEEWLNHQDFDLPIAKLRKKSLYEVVEILVSKVIGNPSAYTQYFLDVVFERELQSQGGLHLFLEYWDRDGSRFSIKAPEGEDAVTLMTIHKSKGLEFPVVILPYAVETFSSRPKDQAWVPLDDSFGGMPRMLTDVVSGMKEYGADASKIYDQKKQEELLDIINVLYVAMTRAEEQLHIISAMNLDKSGQPNKNNLSGFFLDYLDASGEFSASRSEYAFGNPKKVSEQAAEKKPVREITAVLDLLPFSEIRIARRESLMWGSVQQQAIDFGNTLHEILARVGKASELDVALDSCLKEGIISPDVSGLLRTMASEVIHHPELSAFFNSDWRQYREQPLIAPVGPTLIPDRIAMDASGEIQLLDYKTGAEQPKYQEQLESYAAALESMGYRVSKKVLVYTSSPVKVIAL